METRSLIDIVQRNLPPEPWSEGEKIPWNDADFSRRMLNEHLSQTHDAASRRAVIIAQQVHWIHHHVLGARPGRILDLGCGPGLYAARLAALGHVCTGIDFAPASIDYARQQAAGLGLACNYQLADVRTADYGRDYDLAMLIFGEFNVFRGADAAAILRRAWAALKPGGRLLLEAHTFAAVERIGRTPADWSAHPHGLFSDRPYLYLTENFWDEEQRTSTERYYIVDAASGAVQRYAASMQAYHPQEYTALLEDAGFEALQFFPALTGEAEGDPDLCVILARRAG